MIKRLISKFKVSKETSEKAASFIDKHKVVHAALPRSCGASKRGQSSTWGSSWIGYNQFIQLYDMATLDKIEKHIRMQSIEAENRNEKTNQKIIESVFADQRAISTSDKN